MASPFATIRTRSFRIQFDEPAHAYLFDGKRVEHSVSQLAASLKRPFDGLMVASRCSAQKREQWTNNPNCSDAALVAAWNQNGAMAAEAGTRLHAQIETFHKARENPDLCPIIADWMRRTFPRADTDVIPELRIAGRVVEGDERVVAGTIDLLCYDRRTESWSIWDWKRGSISTTNGDEDTLGIGIRTSSHLVYSVQLALYARILRLSYGIDVKHCYLVHTLEGQTPEVVECHPNADAIAEIVALMR
jgi:ATP-dependent exoDNAse (exonuclease V) beta subunit